MFKPSQRIYKNIDTNESFRMYHNSSTGENRLINEITGKEIKTYYCASHIPIVLKFQSPDKLVPLSTGEFIDLTNKVWPTHFKYIGFNFKRI